MCKTLALRDVTSHIVVCSLTIVIRESNRAFGANMRFTHWLLRTGLSMVLSSDHLAEAGLLVTRIVGSGHFMVDTLSVLLLCDSA